MCLIFYTFGYLKKKECFIVKGGPAMKHLATALKQEHLATTALKQEHRNTTALKQEHQNTTALKQEHQKIIVSFDVFPLEDEWHVVCAHRKLHCGCRIGKHYYSTCPQRPLSGYRA